MRNHILCWALIVSICSAQGPPFISPHWPQTTESSFVPSITGPCTYVPKGPHPPFPTPTITTSTQSSPTTGAPACPTIQHSFSSGINSNESRAEEIKSAYLKSWEQYSKNCFGHDTLVVTNNSCVDDLWGWGATIVDALDTAIIMNLTEIVQKQLTHIASVDFTQVENGADQQSPVAGFDVVIRYLGGLIAAYDLLTNSPYQSEMYNPEHVSALLSQAVVLADKIKPQFDTPTGLPAGGVWFNNASLEYSIYQNPLDNKTYHNVCPAVAGTILLEFGRLSDLINDGTYRQLADMAESWILHPYPEPAYPYLIGRQMDVDTGNFITYDFGWSAEIDSFYEYLIKSYIYNPEAETAHERLDFWRNVVNSTYANIVKSPYQWPNLTFISEGDLAANLMYSMDTYSCFAGGNILYGSVYLANMANTTASDLETFSNLGLNITASCRHIYATTVSGTGPAVWSWYDAYNHTYNESWADYGSYRYSAQTRGYFIRDPQYNSFPETIESIFYAWRLTGDQKYQDWNWEIFQSLMDQTDIDEGGDVVYGGLRDVDVPALFENTLDTYYFAETLKYLYLTFVEPDVISLDEWVFNTECHPLRIGGVKSCVKS